MTSSRSAAARSLTTSARMSTTAELDFFATAPIVESPTPGSVGWSGTVPPSPAAPAPMYQDASGPAARASGAPASESRLAPAVGVAATVVALVLSVIFQYVSKHLINAHDVIDVSLRRALVLTLGFYLLVGASVVTFVWRTRARLVWQRRGVAAALALGVPLGLVGGLLGVAVNSAAAGHLSSDPTAVALVGGGGVARIFLTLVVTAVLAPLVEETIFRGLCAGSLIGRGVAPAVWISAIAFAIWHLNPVALRYYAVMGLVFAGIWMKRGLIASMSAHAAFNGVLTVAAVFATTGAATTTTFGAAAVEVPGGWHLDATDSDAMHSIFIGPSGAALILIDKPQPETERTLGSIAQHMAAAPVADGIRVDEASLRQLSTPLGVGVTADFSIDNQPAHVVAVPYQGQLYEVILVTAGNPAAEHQWDAIPSSLHRLT
jgi:membrane protease YdiL (CAAX protease family)